MLARHQILWPEAPWGIKITHVRPRKPSSLRSFLLLCLLAIGPLQAQVAYACAMMDTVVHDDCCCDDPLGEADRLPTQRGTTTDGERTPCCELSVEITVDQETRQHTPIFKPPDRRLDLDLPPALVATLDRPPLSPGRPASYAHFLDHRTADAGSDIWLITRRLRI